jgi:hypothetical protein
LGELGITFDSDVPEYAKEAAYQAAISWGERLSTVIGGSACEAYVAVFPSIKIEWDANCFYCRSRQCIETGRFTNECTPRGGVTFGVSRIMFATMINAPISSRNNMVHEFTVFNNLLNGMPVDELYAAIIENDIYGRTNEDYYPNYGFASEGDPWVQNDSTEPNEIFGDQGIGWVFDTWEADLDGVLSDAGVARQNWMNENMPNYLFLYLFAGNTQP